MMELKEHPRIFGLITVNGTDSVYVKYDCDQVINLMQYCERQSDVKNIVIHGYRSIVGNEKVIVFPKNSVVSYMKC